MSWQMGADEGDKFQIISNWNLSWQVGVDGRDLELVGREFWNDREDECSNSEGKENCMTI